MHDTALFWTGKICLYLPTLIRLPHNYIVKVVIAHTMENDKTSCIIIISCKLKTVHSWIRSLQEIIRGGECEHSFRFDQDVILVIFYLSRKDF